MPKVRGVGADDLDLCRRIDELHMNRPYYGARRISKELQAQGFCIGRPVTLHALARFLPLPARWEPNTQVSVELRRVGFCEDYPAQTYRILNGSVERPDRETRTQLTDGWKQDLLPS